MSRAMQPEDIGLPEGTKPNPYAVLYCRDCDAVPLTAKEYDRQLSNPDRPWTCTYCGQSAEFDDAEFERIHGISDEVVP